LLHTKSAQLSPSRNLQTTNPRKGKRITPICSSSSGTKSRQKQSKTGKGANKKRRKRAVNTTRSPAACRPLQSSSHRTTQCGRSREESKAGRVS
jgi:hypothetical protein